MGIGGVSLSYKRGRKGETDFVNECWDKYGIVGTRTPASGRGVK